MKNAVSRSVGIDDCNGSVRLRCYGKLLGKITEINLAVDFGEASDNIEIAFGCFFRGYRKGQRVSYRSNNGVFVCFGVTLINAVALTARRFFPGECKRICRNRRSRKGAYGGGKRDGDKSLGRFRIDS